MGDEKCSALPHAGVSFFIVIVIKLLFDISESEKRTKHIGLTSMIFPRALVAAVRDDLPAGANVS